MKDTDSLNGSYAIGNNESITMKTASSIVGKFKFKNTLTDKSADDAGKAVITRGYDGESLVVNSGTFTLTNIILDGDRPAIGNTGHTSSAEGGLIRSDTGTLNVTTGTILRNSVTSLRGGAVKIGNDSQTATLKMDGDAKIQNCTAAHGGGIHIGQNGNSTAEISGTAIVNGCTAVGYNSDGNGYGGGIFIHNSKVTISDYAQFQNCEAKARGGAIDIGWGNQELEISDSVKITGSTAVYGGGINIESNGPGKVKISDSVEISGNSASQYGGAVFVENNTILTMDGGDIKNNHSDNGGAVDVADSGAKLYFSGNAKVYNNFEHKNNAATTQQKNVVLNHNDNGIINTTGLGDTARIGIYATSAAAGTEMVTDGNGTQTTVNMTVYDRHGVPNTPFGTFTSNTNLDKFVNDILGVEGTKLEGDDSLVYWKDAPSYIRIKNETSENLKFRLIIDGGKYNEFIRKRGSEKQDPVKASGTIGHYYYEFTLDAVKNNVKGTSETYYIPSGAGKAYVVEVYKTDGTRVNELSTINAKDADGAVLFDSTDGYKNYHGTLFLGPEYKVWDNGDWVYVPSGSLTNYDKGKDGNSYNEAVKDRTKFTDIHLIENGQQVAFMKLDANGNPVAVLNGAKFTLYTKVGCADADKADVETGEAKNAEANVYDGTSWNKDNYDGIVLFDKVPAGIYYMKETTVPTGYSNTDKYVVIVGKDNMTATALSGKVTFEESNTEKVQAALDAQNNAQVDTSKSAAEQEAAKKGYAIFKLNADNKALIETDIVNYGLVNMSSTEKKVILKKTNNTCTPLSGAKFEIYNYDMTLRETTGESQSSGVFWIGKLPLGTYYLKEIQVPGGDDGQYKDNKNQFFKLEVTAEGTTISDTPVAAPDVGMHVVETSAASSGSSGGNPVNPPEPEVTYSVEGLDGTIKVNDTRSVTLKGSDDSTPEGVTWTSSDNTIATVSGNVVTFHAAGNVTITGTLVNGKSGSATVIVNANTPTPGGGDWPVSDEMPENGTVTKVVTVGEVYTQNGSKYVAGSTKTHQISKYYCPNGNYYMVHGSSDWIQRPAEGTDNWILVTGSLF